MALYLIAANAPDLDFIPGLLVGDFDRYHHGISHSIGFAGMFAFALAVGGALWNKIPMVKNFSIFFCLYFSHIVLDSLSVDTSFPHGTPFFWPFSEQHYIAPFAFLPDIRRVSSGNEVIFDLFLPHNLWAMATETLLLLPILLIVLALRKTSSAREQVETAPGCGISSSTEQ